MTGRGKIKIKTSLITRRKSFCDQKTKRTKKKKKMKKEVASFNIKCQMYAIMQKAAYLHVRLCVCNSIFPEKKQNCWLRNPPFQFDVRSGVSGWFTENGTGINSAFSHFFLQSKIQPMLIWIFFFFLEEEGYIRIIGYQIQCKKYRPYINSPQTILKK